ncbi:MAG: MEDS domain-containing protein [Candidatus Riflebacteria bacterium]|nr:MEDS domain-containing protein [Candidatus Riflebacteria bacterium]
MSQKDLLIDMGFTDRKFPVSTHMCLIYNSEDERKKVISKYLHSGVLHGEKVAYLADNATRSEVGKWLVELGVDIQSPDVKKNLEILEAENVYCSGGYFAPDKMLDALKVFQLAAEEKGYSCLRASGEMTWALKGIPGSEKLIAYESRLNDLVVTHPFVALCQYDASKFDGKTIFNVLQVHPYMIVKGDILSNPYYITPADFLKTYNN